MNFRDLQRRISEFESGKIVFVGLGNPIRQDDGAGLALLEELRKRKIVKGAGFIAAGTTPENFLEKIVAHSPQIVLFIDTVRMNVKPGSIMEIPVDEIATRGFSTHSYSIKLIEKYLRSEGIEQYIYIGIEPENMGLAESLSPAVKAGINTFFQ